MSSNYLNSHNNSTKFVHGGPVTPHRPFVAVSICAPFLGVEHLRDVGNLRALNGECVGEWWTLGVKSPLGTGKTQGIAEFVRDAPGVIVITHRQRLVNDNARTFDATPVHSGKQDIVPGVRRLSVCTGSLLRKEVRRSSLPHGGVLVIEEAVAVLHDLCEGQGPRRRRDVIGELRKHARRRQVILADAHLTPETVFAWNRLLGRPEDSGVFLTNAYVVLRGVVTTVATEFAACAGMVEALHRGERVFAPCLTLEVARRVREFAIVAGIPEADILDITGKPTRPKAVRAWIEAPNRDYWLVIATSSIEAGISLNADADGPLFDAIFLFAETLPPRFRAHAAVQMVGRARNTLRLTVLLPRPQTDEMEHKDDVEARADRRDIREGWDRTKDDIDRVIHDTVFAARATRKADWANLLPLLVTEGWTDGGKETPREDHDPKAERKLQRELSLLGRDAQAATAAREPGERWVQAALRDLGLTVPYNPTARPADGAAMHWRQHKRQAAGRSRGDLFAPSFLATLVTSDATLHAREKAESAAPAMHDRSHPGRLKVFVEMFLAIFGTNMDALAGGAVVAAPPEAVMRAGLLFQRAGPDFPHWSAGWEFTGHVENVGAVRQTLRAVCDRLGVGVVSTRSGSAARQYFLRMEPAAANAVLHDSQSRSTLTNAGALGDPPADPVVDPVVAAWRARIEAEFTPPQREIDLVKALHTVRTHHVKIEGANGQVVADSIDAAIRVCEAPGGDRRQAASLRQLRRSVGRTLRSKDGNLVIGDFYRENSGRLRNCGNVQAMPKDARIHIVPTVANEVFVAADMRAAHLSIAAERLASTCLRAAVESGDPYAFLHRDLCPDLPLAAMKLATNPLLNGAGAERLAALLGCSEARACKLRSDFHARIPELARLERHLRDVVMDTITLGRSWVEIPTFLAAKRRIPIDPSDVEGSVRRLLSASWTAIEADIMDETLLRLTPKMHLVTTIFDGLLIACLAEDAARIAEELRAIMVAAALSAGVRLTVKVGHGESWGAAEQSAV